MTEEVRCGFFWGNVVSGEPMTDRCPRPATHTGATTGGVLAVACFEHSPRLEHARPICITGESDDDDETLARAAANQAALERMLSEPTRGT